MRRIELFILALVALGCGGTPAPGASDARVDALPEASIDAQFDVLDAPADLVSDLALDVPGDASAPPDVGDGSSGGCSSEADCDDRIGCTVDRCESSVCSHVPDSTRCPMGQACSSRGCMPSRPCATSSDCADMDPCTVRETCDPSARLCVSGRLDGDRDGHPAVSCGGDDCDDADELVHPGSLEYCNNRDDNCNGRVDEEARCGAGEVCQMGGCACRSPCAGRCVDLMTDQTHCGACGNTCLTESTCVGGRCTCSMTYPDMCSTRCTALERDPANCGACGRACSMLPELLREFGRLCVAGRCQCPPDTNMCMVAGQPMCTLFASDPQNCGRCGNVCSAPTNGTVTCESGMCRIRCNTGYYQRGSACVGPACPEWGSGCDPINDVRCSEGSHCALFTTFVDGTSAYECVEGERGARRESESCTRSQGCELGLLCDINHFGSGICRRPCCGPMDSRCGMRMCRGSYPPPYGQFCQAEP